MTGKLASLMAALGVLLIPTVLVRADETTPTTPATNSTTSSSTTPAHKAQATNIINGKVEKISDTSITLKVTYQTGGKATPHVNVAHVSGSWLPRIVPGPAPKPNPKAKVHTVTRTMTFEIGETPPVKIVTDGPNPTRTTGAYSDIKVGDLAMVGTHPVSVKTDDGKTTSHTQVTGIDVLKHPGATTTTTKPKN